jgi:hypothetical protein
MKDIVQINLTNVRVVDNEAGCHGNVLFFAFVE